MSGTNGSDVGRAAREVRVENAIPAIRIRAAVGAGVTRGNEKRDPAEAKLLELGVDAVHIVLRRDTELLALLTTDTILALLSF